MWHFDSWNRFYSKQLPRYNNINKLKLIESILKQFDSLINYLDIANLKKAIKLASERKAFVLQLGECSEMFRDCLNRENIFHFYRFFMKISHILESKLNIPVVKIARIAGQFAKPRSNLMEENNIPAFRGEIINGFELNSASREPNPERMLWAYFSSKVAIEYLDQAALNFSNTTEGTHYIEKSNTFCNKLYISHEALLLNYESSLTRKINYYYNLSAHMLWLGARTSSYPSPHVEYLRGISNPIGIKLHKDMSPLTLINLIRLLNPYNELGKIILIVRLANNDIGNLLPLFIKEVQKESFNVLFICDPMHGNTKKVNLYKVRYLSDLIENIYQFIKICNSNNIYSGGVHLESTYLNVTECLGGETQEVTEKDLCKNYKTTCDPRLNYNQTMEIIDKLVHFKLN